MSQNIVQTFLEQQEVYGFIQKIKQVIENPGRFKSFKYKAKLIGNTVAEGANGILKNTIIAVPLKYLSNFWTSFKMSFINCKIEIKIKCTKYCVLSVAGNESDVNNNDNANNINFTIKNKK